MSFIKRYLLFLLQNIDKIPLVNCPVLVIHVSVAFVWSSMPIQSHSKGILSMFTAFMAWQHKGYLLVGSNQYM